MNAISDFLRSVLAVAFSLILMVAGAVFAISVFFALLLMVAFSSLRALLSGRKPEPVVLWERWRDMRASSRFGTGFGRGTTGRPDAAARSAEVLDVEVREVNEADGAKGASESDSLQADGAPRHDDGRR